MDLQYKKKDRWYKVRLVAIDYVQKRGINFFELFAPIARLEAIQLLIALEATNGWEIHHLDTSSLDVKTAFSNG